MPDIDVTDVLLDGDVAGELFTLVRRQTSVNAANGQVVIVPTTIPDISAASIAPVGENSLLREEAFQTQMNAIEVITTYRLRGASKDQGSGLSYQPDLVLWQGTYYVVRVLNDWTRYGAGFVAAECIQIDYNDTPPAA